MMRSRGGVKPLVRGRLDYFYAHAGIINRAWSL